MIYFIIIFIKDISIIFIIFNYNVVYEDLFYNKFNSTVYILFILFILGCIYIIYLLCYIQYESNTFVDFTRHNFSLNNNTKSNDEILKNKIFELSNELNIEKNNNKDLSNRIQELEKIIKIKGKQNINNEDKNIINELSEKLRFLNNNLNNSINKEEKYNQLLEEIRIKDNIISNYPIKLSEGENLISVIFVSLDQKVHYSVICKNTDKFNIVENKLYEEYPEYLESENYFIVNGNKINKYKSLEFNKIKNNDIIMLKTI